MIMNGHGLQFALVGSLVNLKGEAGWVPVSAYGYCCLFALLIGQEDDL